ncbi:MAG: hypothetical protein M3281_05035, partial [Chloroflexota bacterium]|nr:hypothetical protein [Chloroflexota bacterium]
MQRYTRSDPYGLRRRRTHRVRNSAIVVLALVIAGVLFANTGAGASVLQRLGLRDTGAPGVAGPTTMPTTVPDSTPADNGTGALPTAPAAGPVGTEPPGPPGATPSADPLVTANRYLTKWQQGKYADMYHLLSRAAKQQYPRDRFVTRYKQIRDVATIQSVEPKLLPEAQQAAQSQELLLRLPFSVKIVTKAVGEVDESNLLTLVKEDELWRVQWSPSLIFKDLSGDNRIRLSEYPAPRGSIFDRNGKALAMDGEIVQLGVAPGEIKNENELLSRVSKALGVSPKFVKDKYKA